MLVLSTPASYSRVPRGLIASPTPPPYSAAQGRVVKEEHATFFAEGRSDKTARLSSVVFIAA